MSIERRNANKEIYELLCGITKQKQDVPFVDIIKEYCIDDSNVFFYVEPWKTKEHIENKIRLEELKISDNTEDNLKCNAYAGVLQNINALIDEFPDQRFGQIMENYVTGPLYKL